MTGDLWIAGTSIERGVGLPSPATDSWPGQLDVLCGGGRVRNLGVGGAAVAYTDPHTDPATDVPDTIVSVVRCSVLTAPVLPKAVIIGGPVNDLVRSVDTTPTRQAVLDLSRWLARRGIAPLVATITPIRSDGSGAAALSTRRAEFNDWARVQFGVNTWDTSGWLLDIGDVLTAGGTYADPRLYRDPLHPNRDGMAALATAAHDLLQQKGLP